MARSGRLSADDVAPADGARGSKYDERFSHVLKAAAQVFADDGYEKATIRRIASKARMSIAGLYYYVTSKEELLFSIQLSTFEGLVRDLKARLDADKDASAEKRIRIVVENHFQHFQQNLPELKVCARELEALKGDSYRQVLERRREYYLITRQAIDELASGSDDPPDSNLAALSLFGMLNWAYMWFTPRRHRDLEKLETQLGNIFINGVKPRSNREQRTGSV